MSLRLLALPLVLLAACGENGGPADGGVIVTRKTCIDATGAPLAECPLAPKAFMCSGASANDCMAVPVEEVRQGTTSPCLRVSLRNTCGDTAYSRICLEYLDGSASWQCWDARIVPDHELDFGQCGATGRYFRFSTRTAGEMDILKDQCLVPD